MNRLKELRQRKKLSQKEFAAAFNKFLKDSDSPIKDNHGNIKKISYATVSRWENGQTPIPSIYYSSLAAFLDVSLPYLQGLGMSLDQAIDLCWEWARNDDAQWLQFYHERWAMGRIFKDFFASRSYSKDDLNKIFSSKENFCEFMVKNFRAVFNYDDLSQLKGAEDLENKLAIAMGNLEQSAYASIYDIDFKNDSNDEIHDKLQGIFETVFTYIHDLENKDFKS
jgi:transcriptional regulator with XRE-family HTH domain